MFSCWFWWGGGESVALNAEGLTSHSGHTVLSHMAGDSLKSPGSHRINSSIHFKSTDFKLSSNSILLCLAIQLALSETHCIHGPVYFQARRRLEVCKTGGLSWAILELCSLHG